jgi:hypothetical protein
MYPVIYPSSSSSSYNSSSSSAFQVAMTEETIDVIGDYTDFEVRMTEETIDVLGRNPQPTIKMTEETIDVIGDYADFEVKMTEETIDAVGRETDFSVLMTELTIDVIGTYVAPTPTFTPSSSSNSSDFQINVTQETVDVMGETYNFEIRTTQETVDAMGETALFEIRTTQETIDAMGETNAFEVRTTQETIDVMGQTCCSTLEIIISTYCCYPCGFEITNGRVYAIGNQCIYASYTLTDDCLCSSDTPPFLINGQVSPVTILDGEEVIITVLHSPNCSAIPISVGCYTPVSLFFSKFSLNKVRKYLSIGNLLKVAKKILRRK